MENNDKFTVKFTKENLINQIKKYASRWFITAMSSMALGLFSTLVIGLILTQLSKFSVLGIIAPFAEMASNPIVVGGAIGAAIASGLKMKPMVIYSSVVAGAIGYSMGGPVGAYVASLVGAELGSLVAGRTPVDIIVTPIVTIIAGGFAGQLVGPGVSVFMDLLGSAINAATAMAPLPMSILVAVLVGMVLSSPISSAALCIMLDLSGLAAGAAVVGCCCQMIGFGVTSFSDNGLGGLLSQGLGTSKLQFSNIVKKPVIWLSPILASAILGPISACVFKMENIAASAGMGTSGLVGQLGAITAMPEVSLPILLTEILLMHFILPALLAFLFDKLFRKLGWIKAGDMKLSI